MEAPVPNTRKFNVTGLSAAQVAEARQKHGINAIHAKEENAFLRAIKGIGKEPMVILLLIASSLYFFTGETADGLFLAASILFVAAISLYQESRSRNALEALKALTKPTCKVIRDGETIEIQTEDLVIGDSLLAEEGAFIAADATIVHSNDFAADESLLTGESMPIFKDSTSEDHFLYAGTTVASGLAIGTVTAIASGTRLGQIGRSLENIQEEKTPLETKINDFVRKMVIAGAIVFIIVWAINYFRSGLLFDSLLKALTLAMSILPEEIPVAFTTFMALGAWRLMRTGIVVKQMKTVETLGSATVICTDKTGTITENKMSLVKLYVLETNSISGYRQSLSEAEQDLITCAMWASEPIPFDPMEKALHQAYRNLAANDERPHYPMIHEYPLGGKPPMMTHIFENAAGQRIIAAKGAPEALIAVSNLTETEKKQVTEAINTLAGMGFRLLGVAEAQFAGQEFLPRQQDYAFELKGIVAFYDPPKANIQAVFEDFYNAGIAVKIITGDNALTTASIARQVGFRGADQSITGDEVMELTTTALQARVQKIQLYTRMFPEAKLRVINALKAKNEIVAMTGDGINDGPALKAAHIGIAMGKRGTEIARQAASLILQEDDLSKIVVAVAMGRRIYANLKKAIRYIISIHIPIILTVFIPLALGWTFPNLLSPVHIIFLELIMGPTCSIIYENEPMEKRAMLMKPRPYTSTFFSWRELATSILQGVAIAAGVLSVYAYAVSQSYDETITRTMVFTALVAGNIFLTLVNRSFYDSVFTAFRYRNQLIWIIIGITLLLITLLIYLPPLAHFFGFAPLSPTQLAITSGAGFVSVAWYELVKLARRARERNPIN